MHLNITDDLETDDTIEWILNDSLWLVDPTSPSSYEATKSIPLTSSPFTYVRAQVRRSSGTFRMMTQPIFFRDVASLPAGMHYYVDEVATPNGRDYTNIATKGIVNTSWNNTSQTLWLSLENPAGSLVTVITKTGTTPQAITVDGAAV